MDPKSHFTFCLVSIPFYHYRYAIYRDGKLDKEVTNVIDCWPEQSVAFLIGCSFSYDGELMDAGIPLKSASQGKNVPMHKTNLKCRPAGSLSGNMVVSMKPIPALQISKHVSTVTYKCATARDINVYIRKHSLIYWYNIKQRSLIHTNFISHIIIVVLDDVLVLVFVIILNLNRLKLLQNTHTHMAVRLLLGQHQLLGLRILINQNGVNL